MSTYSVLYYHIVFSTKQRIPHIHKSWRSDLHNYTAGAIKGLGGTPNEVGGVDDHIHLLVGLTTSHCIKDFVRTLKVAITKWVHSKHGLRNFAWQEGYAVFTISSSIRPNVQKYILNQEEHHKTVTFKDELINFLKSANLNFDPRYLD